MEFAKLLDAEGISPAAIALALHRPAQATTRNALLDMAANEPALFDLYQSTHARGAEATLRKRGFMASFVARGEGEAVFLGLFAAKIVAEMATVADLKAHGFPKLMDRLNAAQRQETETLAKLQGRAVFGLARQGQMDDLVGRLIVALPSGRSYMRLAETTRLDVLELRRERQITPPIPEWDQMKVDRAQLQTLPRDWAITLRNWRGIYLILDRSDGARYVGAAYGEENLLLRWRQHCAGEHGVTKDLKRRNTDDFQFSILELLAPNASAEDVIASERRWMDRLGTIEYGLNS